MAAKKPDPFDSYPWPVWWAVKLVAFAVAAWLVSIVATPIHQLTTPQATPRYAQASGAEQLGGSPSNACIEATANEAWTDIERSCADYGDELAAMWLTEKGRARGERVLVGDQIDYCTNHQEINTWLCTSWDLLFPGGKPPAATPG